METYNERLERLLQETEARPKLTYLGLGGLSLGLVGLSLDLMAHGRYLAGGATSLATLVSTLCTAGAYQERTTRQ